MCRPAEDGKFSFKMEKRGGVPVCSTGDLANNIDKLRFELQQSKYAGLIDVRAWRKGTP